MERDKMAINLFFTEVYPIRYQNVKDKTRLKKKIMQNKEDWEARGVLAIWQKYQTRIC